MKKEAKFKISFIRKILPLRLLLIQYVFCIRVINLCCPLFAYICFLPFLFSSRTVGHPTKSIRSLNVPSYLGRVFAIGTLSVCYIYSSEIFPTVVRNVGLGSSSVWARVGPMVSPSLPSSGNIHEKNK